MIFQSMTGGDTRKISGVPSTARCRSSKNAPSIARENPRVPSTSGFDTAKRFRGRGPLHSFDSAVFHGELSRPRRSAPNSFATRRRSPCSFRNLISLLHSIGLGGSGTGKNGRERTRRFRVINYPLYMLISPVARRSCTIVRGRKMQKKRKAAGLPVYDLFSLRSH